VRRLLALCLLFGLGAVGRAAERGVPLEDHAFVELDASPQRVFVGQPLRVRVLVGFERRFLEENLVARFSRRLDLQAQLTAPWVDGLPDAVLLDGPAATGARGAGQGWSLALNDDMGLAFRVSDRAGTEGPLADLPFTVLAVQRTFVPTAPGEIRLPAPVLRFACATEFRKDFLRGRTPVDRREVTLTGAPLVVEVRPLPEEGRPAEFGGAVGRFAVTAEAEPRELEFGDTLKLTLRIEGEGNLALLDPPRLDDLPGFHVYGALDDRGSRLRTIVFDLAPTATVGEVPGIALPFFDPEAEEYRTARSAPIPLVVRGAPAPEGGSGGGGSRWRVVLALAVAVGAVGLLARRRARRRERVDPAVLRAREAAATFREAAAREGTDLAAALAEYLAVHLDCRPAAVISPDLRRRLGAADVPPDLADRTAALLETLVAARYGATSGADDAAAEARKLVDDLDAHFGAGPLGDFTAT
jgi:hypothetical protein